MVVVAGSYVIYNYLSSFNGRLVIVHQNYTIYVINLTT